MRFLSKSGIRLFYRCPLAYRFYYFPLNENGERCPPLTDYPRLCGSVIHDAIARLHTAKSKDNRPLHYKTLAKFQGYFSHLWQKKLTECEQNHTLISPNVWELKQYPEIGYVCLANYYKSAQKMAPPIEVEKLYKYPYPDRFGIGLTGIVDQIRAVSLDYIARHRPELMVNGQLNDQYASVIIVDLKSEANGFASEENIDGELLYRKQYLLHTDIQATMYTWLYWKNTGKKPVGFAWYHLRSGKWFFTFREEADFINLFIKINRMVDNLQSWDYDDYSMNEGSACAHCDFVHFCQKDRELRLVDEELPEDSCGAQITASPIIEIVNPQQPKFKFPKVTNKKPSKPIRDDQPKLPLVMTKDLP